MSLDVRDVRLPQACACPGCGAPNDAATSTRDDQEQVPRPGDASICLTCAEILVFRDDMTTRLMSAGELADLDAGDRSHLLLARRAVRQVHEWKATKEGEA